MALAHCILGKFLRGRLPLLSPAFRRSHFCRQMPPRPHVTMVDKNKGVVCCLLATSAVMLSEKKKRKRKMWSKKWYLKRNISCDADLLSELLEADVP